ncbi:pygopus homolog 2-like [Styela clava]
MPKKSSKDGGETKKRQRLSSTKDRNSSATSPGSNEVLLPPTPTATHLVASNPFDDPPSNVMNNPGGPMMQGPPRMMMHSPLHNPGMTSPYGPVGQRSNWVSSPVGPQQRPTRPYGSPGGPNWNGSGMMSPVGHMVPGYQPDPQMMSPTEYGYNRPMMNHPNPNHPMYRPPPRMMGRFGDGSPPMNSERIPMPRMPGPMHGMPHNNGNPGQNMLVGPGGQMKILSRPNLQTSIPQPLPSNRKSSNSKSDKSSRSDSGSTTPKSKKKSKAAEAKLAKSAANEADDKSWKSNAHGAGNKSNLSSPGSGVVAPHAVPPVLPQTCFQCHKEINYPGENCICCLASCNIWYHLSCTGLTDTAYNCLRSEELALWACDNCLRVKEIDSVRLRDPGRSDLSNSNSNGNGLPIVGKA